VYGKLGIRSRTELARTFDEAASRDGARREPPPAAPDTSSRKPA
jgi:hypothetical protein